MRVKDGRVYLATPDCGFDIVLFYPGDEPGVVNVRPGPVNDLAIHDERAYLAVGTEGLLVYDISDPGNVEIVGHIEVPLKHEAYRIQISDMKAYLYSESVVGGLDPALQIIDISNPAFPAVLYEHPMDWDGLMRVAGDVAYFFSDNQELLVTDVSDPSIPNFYNHFSSLNIITIERYFEGYGILDMQISGEYLLLTYEDHVSILTGLPGVCQPTCGNSTREHPETCDDGNLTPGDGCNDTCTGP